MKERASTGRRERRVSRRVRTRATDAVRPPRGTEALARRLRSRLLAPVLLELTDNTYTMISFTRRSGAYRLRLHRMFLRADEEVLVSLVRYIQGDDRRASAHLDRFIQSNRRHIREVTPQQRQGRLRLRAAGKVHDLGRLLQHVRDEFFGEAADGVAIAWAPAPRVSLPRRSIKLGSYSADTQIIRIHPALDQPLVPEFFVKWIIHHELLHHVFREDLKARRGQVHTPEFCRLERQYPHYAEAILWERRNLDLLLWWDPARGGPSRTAAQLLTLPAAAAAARSKRDG